jgi:hypothetical protein
MGSEPSNENLEETLNDLRHQAAGVRDELMERLPDSERPHPDLPQDPGIPGGPPSPEPEREGSLERPHAPDDPPGIDAPGSKHEPPPNH